MKWVQDREEITVSPFTQVTLYTTLGAVVIRLRLYSLSSLSCKVRKICKGIYKTWKVQTHFKLLPLKENGRCFIEKKAYLNYFHVEKTQEPTSEAKTHGTWGLWLKLHKCYRIKESSLNSVYQYRLTLCQCQMLEV